MKLDTIDNNKSKTSSLEEDIKRLEEAIALMEEANKALANHNFEKLKELGFTTDHVLELRKKQDTMGYGFPEYTIENNRQNIELLKLVVKKVLLNI